VNSSCTIYKSIIQVVVEQDLNFKVEHLSIESILHVVEFTLRPTEIIAHSVFKCQSMLPCANDFVQIANRPKDLAIFVGDLNLSDEVVVHSNFDVVVPFWVGGCKIESVFVKVVTISFECVNNRIPVRTR